MFLFGLSKLRLIGLVILCILTWKFMYFVTKHPSFQVNILDNDFSFVHRKDFNFQLMLSTNDTLNDKQTIEKVLVSVYYEALCSDSRNFILKQLVPAYEKAPNLIELDLIPYGKATVI